MTLHVAPLHSKLWLRSSTVHSTMPLRYETKCFSFTLANFGTTPWWSYITLVFLFRSIPLFKRIALVAGMALNNLKKGEPRLLDPT